MKYFKSYILFALLAVSMAACKQDDLKDDLDGLKDRVTLLEEQVKILNDNVEVLAYVLDPGNLTISKVEESSDGTQYIITLSNGDELALTIGEPGSIDESLSIEVSEDGYWVINNVKTQTKAIGENGKDGEGIPQFKVEDGRWKVSFNGTQWEDVQGGSIEGAGSLGDQFFVSAELIEDGDYFQITTTDGQVIKLPVTGLTCVISVDGDATQPVSFTVGEIKDFNVKIEGGEPLAPIYPAGWRAELLEKSEVDADGNNYTLTVYAPATVSRVAADNGKDISVRVTNGTVWAVDKIAVEVQAQP